MIHKTAVIDPGAKLGKDVSIGPFGYVEKDVEIGDGCVIGSNVSILRYTTLGPGCQVHAGAVLGDVPQDLGFPGEVSYVKIGARCVIREGVTINRGTKPGTSTEIGDGCFLMACSHFAHNVRLGNGVIVANGALLAGYVEVGDRAFISGNCVFHQFIRIGRLAMIGGLAGLSKDVPPFCLVRPVSLNTVAGLNVVGMRRAQFNAETRKEVKKAFELLYRSGVNIREAAARIQEEFASGPAHDLGEFVKQSRRGICRGPGRAGEEEESEEK